MCDHLPHIFGDELVLTGGFADKTTPPCDITTQVGFVFVLFVLNPKMVFTCNVARCNEELLPHPPLQHNVPAGAGLRIKLQATVQAGLAEVGVALARREIAGAVVGRAVALTTTPCT